MTFHFNAFKRALGAPWRALKRRWRLWSANGAAEAMPRHCYAVRHAYKPWDPDSVVAVLYRSRNAGLQCPVCAQVTHFIAEHTGPKSCPRCFALIEEGKPLTNSRQSPNLSTP